MRNIINRHLQDKKVFTGWVYLNIDTIIWLRLFIPSPYITANVKLAYGFAIGRAIPYPLQDPIKNIITHPE